MLTLHIAGLSIYDGKTVIVKSWDIVWGKRNHGMDTWVVDTVDYLL